MGNNAPKVDIIVGCGLTGFSVANYLKKQNIPFEIVDSRENPPGIVDFKKAFPDIKIHLGPFDKNILARAKRLIVSPGININDGVLFDLKENGVRLIGDIELFVGQAKAPIIAITGTNGKSTVTKLVGELINATDKKAHVGGNIGVPALDLLELPTPDYYVLELSSYQLETTFNLKGHLGVLLNITRDHLDRYEDFNDYIIAKQLIFNNASHMVTNIDDELTKPNSVGSNTCFGMSKPLKGQFGLIEKNDNTYLAYGDELLLDVNDLSLKGTPNWQNALAALAVIHHLGFSFDKVLPALKSFKGLPHRCEVVSTNDNILWVNDSKGTNIGATNAAIDGFSKHCSGKLVLIAGGQAKEDDFSNLLSCIKEHVFKVITLGEAAPLLESSINGHVPFIRASTMCDAVLKAHESVTAGDCVLLSPACASFDMYENFNKRGEDFTKHVLDLVK